jgi:hypothetical protein
MTFSDKRELLLASTIAFPGEEDWGAEIWAKLMRPPTILNAVHGSLSCHLALLKDGGKFDSERLVILSIKIFSSLCYHFPHIGFRREPTYRVLAYFFAINIDPKLYHEMMVSLQIAWTESMVDVTQCHYGLFTN